MLVFDLETDGFLPVLTTIHTLTIYDTETGEYSTYNDQGTADGAIGDAVLRLSIADALCGHNIIGFDIPAIKKLYPWFKPIGAFHDTLLYSQILYGDLKDRDARARLKGREIPGKLVGSHKLEAWGCRLGLHKGDYSADMKEKGLDPWAEWNQEMEDYCVQDVAVSVALWNLMATKNLPPAVMEMESQVAQIIARQVARGFTFDEAGAQRLHITLTQRKLELEGELQEVFKPFYLPSGKVFTPKKDSKQYGYVEGAPLCKVKLTQFNAGSRDHISNRLISLRGWKPKEHTENGKPKVDDAVISALPYPEAKPLGEYLMIGKRLGQVADGDNAWLKLVRNGRIHGAVFTNGTVTGRMAHFAPNVAQVPANSAPYGTDCRALFGPSKGFVQVGCDADGLELRCLAHFMARYDEGAYALTVVEGKKSDKTDAHSVNMMVVGLRSRDSAKTYVYALMYGSGDYNLGTIILEDMDPKDRKRFRTDKAIRNLGRKSREKLMKGLPAFGALVEDVKKAAGRGYLKGLDGRKLHVRSAHSALNTLLQSAGALVMKRALVILDDSLQTTGFVPGVDYEFIANVHDEFQIETRPEIAEQVGKMAADAIRLAGDFYNFRCPLAGSYAIGKNWSETH